MLRFFANSNPSLKSFIDSFSSFSPLREEELAQIQSYLIEILCGDDVPIHMEYSEAKGLVFPKAALIRRLAQANQNDPQKMLEALGTGRTAAAIRKFACEKFSTLEQPEEKKGIWRYHSKDRTNDDPKDILACDATPLKDRITGIEEGVKACKNGVFVYETSEFHEINLNIFNESLFDLLISNAGWPSKNVIRGKETFLNPEIVIENYKQHKEEIINRLIKSYTETALDCFTFFKESIEKRSTDAQLMGLNDQQVKLAIDQMKSKRARSTAPAPSPAAA